MFGHKVQNAPIGSKVESRASDDRIAIDWMIDPKIIGDSDDHWLLIG